MTTPMMKIRARWLMNSITESNKLGTNTSQCGMKEI